MNSSEQESPAMTDTLTMSQARYIFTTGKMIRDRIERIVNDYLSQMGKTDAYLGLSYPQFHAMMMVRMREPLFMSELADILGISPSSASAMVDKLVERNFLTHGGGVSVSVDETGQNREAPGVDHLGPIRRHQVRDVL